MPLIGPRLKRIDVRRIALVFRVIVFNIMNIIASKNMSGTKKTHTIGIDGVRKLWRRNTYRPPYFIIFNKMPISMYFYPYHSVSIASIKSDNTVCRFLS